MLKRLIAGAASLALTLGGVALVATPAQALTGASCDDGDAWSWSIANPARYQAGPHEAVVGLSEAIRTVTIKAPTGCTVDARGHLARVQRLLQRCGHLQHSGSRSR